MLLFGHIGITLAAAGLFGQTATKLSSGKIKPSARTHKVATEPESNPANPGASWIPSLENLNQMTLLAIGSLLPDIIDKPVGHLLFRETISNGRIYCHTLLFFVSLTIAAVFVYRYRRKTWLLVLSFGTGMHLILDQIWLAPQTLLWPLYGPGFAKLDSSRFLSGLLDALKEPSTYVPELLGLAIVLWLAIALLRRRKTAGIPRIAITTQDSTK